MIVEDKFIKCAKICIVNYHHSHRNLAHAIGCADFTAGPGDMQVFTVRVEEICRVNQFLVRKVKQKMMMR